MNTFTSKHFCLSLIILLASAFAPLFAQQGGVSVDTTGAVADNSAMLDVQSTTRGFLTPRMLSTQRTAIPAPATGLIVYQTDAPAGFYYYNGTAWVQIATTPLGQSSVTVVGTAPITVTPATAFTLIPGMTIPINVPANSVVHITGDGGLQTTSTLAGGFSIVDVAILIDGARPAGAVAYRRIGALNNAGLGSNLANWSMSFSVPLAAGPHTIVMAVAGDGIGSNATVSGIAATSVLAAEMTATILAN